jgi:GNAT superfamily N-acetyltransferase
MKRDWRMDSQYECVMLTYYQIREALAEGGLMNLIRKRVFWQRTATPAEMDLSTIPAFGGFVDSDYRFIELKLEDLQSGEFNFMIPSRSIKALVNLKKGWRGFGIAKGSNLVGDIWCITPYESGKSVAHPDLDMLGISGREREAYAFDMLIDSAYRGKNLAVPLQRFLQSTLKEEGYKKMYGFYWDDNLPALWMHRMIKYKELPKRRVSRFFFLQTAQTLR